jgi:hypothetical protein
MVFPVSSRLPVSEVKYSRSKYRCFNSGTTTVYALSCLYTYSCAHCCMYTNQHTRKSPRAPWWST